jgi:23S rRNA G2445 N2-methylase RlmL
VEVWGNDVHSGALGLALRDVQAAGVQPMVRLHHGECRAWQLPRRPALVVSNPPWGQRLRGRGGGGDAGGEYNGDSGSGGSSIEEWWEGSVERHAEQPGRGRQRLPVQAADEAEALRATWWDLSGFLKRQAPGATAFLLSGDPAASQGLRMKAERRFPLTIGGTDCRLLQYSIRGLDRGEGEAGKQHGQPATAAGTAGSHPLPRQAASGGFKEA